MLSLSASIAVGTVCFKSIKLQPLLKHDMDMPPPITIEEDLARLNIKDEEDEPVVDQFDEEDDEDDFSMCLVKRFLTNRAVHFPSLRNILAKIWHPIEGVTITELEEKRILFRFYNELDINRVIKCIPWFFNRHLIILHRLSKGENPVQIPFFLQVCRYKFIICPQDVCLRVCDAIGQFFRVLFRIRCNNNYPVCEKIHANKGHD